MRWFPMQRRLAIGASLLIMLLAGCSQFQTKATPPWKKKIDPQVAHVITSKQRIEKMRETAKKAPTLSPAEQERESFELTQVLRQGEDDPLIRAEVLRTLAVFP